MPACLFDAGLQDRALRRPRQSDFGSSQHRMMRIFTYAEIRIDGLGFAQNCEDPSQHRLAARVVYISGLHASCVPRAGAFTHSCGFRA